MLERELVHALDDHLVASTFHPQLGAGAIPKGVVADVHEQVAILGRQRLQNAEGGCLQFIDDVEILDGGQDYLALVATRIGGHGDGVEALLNQEHELDTVEAHVVVVVHDGGGHIATAKQRVEQPLASAIVGLPVVSAHNQELDFRSGRLPAAAELLHHEDANDSCDHGLKSSLLSVH